MNETVPSRLRKTLVHSVARTGLALVFAYHGLIPKLISPHRDEIAMLRDAGITAERCGVVLAIFGIAEVMLSLCLLFFWGYRWPAWLCFGLMLAGTIGVAVNSPRYLGAAFNPVSLNLAVACLAVIDLIVLQEK